MTIELKNEESYDIYDGELLPIKQLIDNRIYRLQDMIGDQFDYDFNVALKKSANDALVGELVSVQPIVEEEDGILIIDWHEIDELKQSLTSSGNEKCLEIIGYYEKIYERISKLQLEIISKLKEVEGIDRSSFEGF